MTSSFARQSKKRTTQSKKHWKPHAYQRKALKFVVERDAAILLLDPGLGKTAITLAAALALKRADMFLGALVVAPLRVARLVWRQEQEEWEEFKGLRMCLLRGTDSELERMLTEEPGYDFYITNYEQISKYFTRVRKGKLWKYVLTPLGRLLMERVNMLVWDEISKMKNHEAMRHKLIAPHLRLFERKVGLTGSIASNGLMNLFGQCYAVDQGRSLGVYVTHYRHAYFQQVNEDNRTYALLPGAEERIYERLAPLCLRMDAEDYLDLPPLLTRNIKVDLPPEVREKYDELESLFLTRLGTDVLTAPNKAATNNLCAQFCAGAVFKAQVDFLTGVKLAGPRQWIPLHEEKLDAMVDLLEELQGQQVFIAYHYNHDHERIMERLEATFGKHAVARFGHSEKSDLRIQDAWNAGDLQYVLGHPASVAHGLNLQKSNAHNLLWYTPTWDYELYDQFIRRLRRQGTQAQHINNYRLVARDTIDESICWSLSQKKRTQDLLYKALKERRRVGNTD